MIKEEDLHKIGVFAKPHGVKGEISLISDYRLDGLSGNLYFVCSIDELFVPFFVTSIRQKSASSTLVKFENMDSADRIKCLSGKSAFMNVDLLPLLGEHPIHQEDLTGYTINDDRYGVIGEVIDVDYSTPNILLKVKYQEKEILVPLSLITSISQHPHMMNTLLPNGFLEI